MKTVHILDRDDQWFARRVEELFNRCGQFPENEDVQKVVARIRGNAGFTGADIELIASAADQEAYVLQNEPAECPWPDMPGRDIAAEWAETLAVTGKQIAEKAATLRDAWDEIRPMELRDIRRQLASIDMLPDSQLRNGIRMLYGDIADEIDGRWDGPGEDAA